MTTTGEYGAIPESFRNPLVLLVSPHFQRASAKEMLLLMSEGDGDDY